MLDKSLERHVPFDPISQSKRHLIVQSSPDLPVAGVAHDVLTENLRGLVLQLGNGEF